MITYLRFINPFKRYPASLVGTGINTLFYVAFNALSLWLIAPVLRVIFLPGDKAEEPTIPLGGLQSLYQSLKQWSWQFFAGDDPIAALPRLCITLVVVFLLKNIFGYGQMHFVSFVEQRMIKDLRDLVFSHVSRQSYGFFDRRPTGQLMSIVMNDVQMLSVTFQRVFTQAVRDPLTVIVLLGLLFSISWQLTLMAAVIVPLFGVVYKWIGESLKRKSARIQEKLADLTTHLQEAISGARVVKAFGTERHESKRFEGRNLQLFGHSLRLARLNRLAPPLSETIGVIIIASVLLFGGRQVLSGSLLDAEDFLRFIVVLFSILTPIRSIGNIHNYLQVGSAAGARIQKLLDEQSETADTGSTDIKSFERDIVFDNVSFRYPTKPDRVLKNIRLTIAKNERIALVGRSGSGKSTLANLIPRFYDPQEGKLLIDGTPATELTLSSLRSQVSTVSQDVFLFNESVRYNIEYGVTEINEERLRDVIRRAHAEEFVSALPQGLDTLVGERGTQLSGGQKQRIAIARALLRNSPILIFDEATSALDTESERLIQRALDELFRERTVILIAHRLSTIRYADRIVLLDDGAIADIGSHDELLKRSDLYRTLTALYEQEP